MSNDIKCPFCKKELKLIGEKSDSGYPIDEYVCSCPETVFCFGNTVMWHKLRVLQNQLEESREDRKRAEKELMRTKELLKIKSSEHDKCLAQMLKITEELIRTRKQLDIAVDMLKIMNDGLPNGNRWKWEIEKTLEQITALEQKD